MGRKDFNEELIIFRGAEEKKVALRERQGI